MVTDLLSDKAERGTRDISAICERHVRRLNGETGTLCGAVQTIVLSVICERHARGRNGETGILCGYRSLVW